MLRRSTYKLINLHYEKDDALMDLNRDVKLESRSKCIIKSIEKFPEIKKKCKEKKRTDIKS